MSEETKASEVIERAWSLSAKSGVTSDPEKVKAILLDIIDRIDNQQAFLGGAICLAIDEGDGVSLINSFMGTAHVARATKLSLDDLMEEPIRDANMMAVTACMSLEALKEEASECMATKVATSNVKH